MKLIEIPMLDSTTQAKVVLLERAWEKVSIEGAYSKPWAHYVRRNERLRTLRAMMRLAGKRINLEDALAIVHHVPAVSLGNEGGRQAEDYNDVLGYGLAVAHDRDFVWSPLLLRTLHYMESSWRGMREIGQWRTGTPWEGDGSSQFVYAPPAPRYLPELAAELCESLNHYHTHFPGVILGAMAELQVSAIMPIHTDNHSFARLINRILVSRTGLLDGNFVGLEDGQAKFHAQYVQRLQGALGYSYLSAHGAAAWIEFCLDMLINRSQGLMVRIEQTEAQWKFCQNLVSSQGYPPESHHLLLEALSALRIKPSVSKVELEISESTISQLLRQLVADGWLIEGHAKGDTAFVGSEALRHAYVRRGGQPRNYELPLQLALS